MNRTIRRCHAIAVVLTLIWSASLLASNVSRQATSPPNFRDTAQAKHPTSIQSQANVSPQNNSPPSSSADAMLGAMTRDVGSRLDRIEAKVDLVSHSLSDRWFTAGLGFLGVLAGAAVSGGTAAYLQSKRLQSEQDAAERSSKRQEEHADRKFGLDALAVMHAFQARQLNDFYGPFRVFLAQVGALRRELDSRLLLQTQGSDISLTLSGEGRRRRLMVVQSDNSKKGFRLIEQMPFIYQHYPHLMPNIGELVASSDLLVEHIHRNGGLLNPQSSWLGTQIATYLAHQRVMKEIYQQLIAGGLGPATANYSTVYPRLMDVLVERDYRSLRRSQQVWQRQARTWTNSA